VDSARTIADKQGCDVFRSLHTLLVSNSLYLSLALSVHVFVGGNKSLVPKRVEPEGFPVLEILDENDEFRRDKMHEKLEVAWRKTAFIGPEGLDSELGVR
jgi:hypothetical protein